jgi:hypothetical protein
MSCGCGCKGKGTCGSARSNGTSLTVLNGFQGQGVRKAMFDPRRENIGWPEPNDDPNIPYAWGLDGYRSNYSDKAQTASEPIPPTTEEEGFLKKHRVPIVGIALAGLVFGAYKMAVRN